MDPQHACGDSKDTWRGAELAIPQKIGPWPLWLRASIRALFCNEMFAGLTPDLGAAHVTPSPNGLWCGLWKNSQREENVENKVFIHSPRKERGKVWWDTPARRGGGFELLLDYNWIKKGWTVAVVRPLGKWRPGNQAAVCSSVIFCPWL